MNYMNKNILVINGHPNPQSFSKVLANAYVMGASESGFNVELINVHELSFNPHFIGQHDLEEDLKMVQQKISNCQHLVIVTPMWWLSVPALLKGFFDRVLTPGYAYKFKSYGRVSRLLKGRSARVIYTLGGQSLMYRLLFLDSFWMSLKFGVLWLCGFSPVRRTVFSRVPYISQEMREKMIEQVKILGKMGK
jgi:NAD(P)H dehydrogenase (quinone)